MLAEVSAQCEALSHNYEALHTTNLPENASVALAAAGIYTALHKAVDAALLSESCTLLKRRTNLLSSYRGTMEFVIECKMAISGDPAAYFDRTESIRSLLRSGNTGSESTILAAMILADTAEAPEECAVLAARTSALFRQMKTQHRFLTDEYDLPFAAVMALTQRPYDAVLGDAEACFAILKTLKFGESNALQSLSHVLSLYRGSAADKCEKIAAVRNALRNAGHPFPAGGRLALLGMLAGTQTDAAALAEMIAEADDFLEQQPCFAEVRFPAERDVRRMYAVSAVCSALGQPAEDSLNAAAEEAIMLWMLLMTANVF